MISRFFKRIYFFIKNLRASAKPSVQIEHKPRGNEPNFGFIPIFFFIVGHNPKSKGARNEVNQEYEYDFSFRIGDKFLQCMADLCPILVVHKITRPVGTYGHQVRSVKNKIKSITKGMRSYALSSHFNAGGGSGSENLIIKGTSDNFDNLFADMLSDALETILSIPQRRDNGVFEISSNHNGFGMLNGIFKVNCIGAIVEPTWKRDFPESRKIFNHEDIYVRILTETVISTYLRRGLINKKSLKKSLKYWDVSGDVIKPRISAKYE